MANRLLAAVLLLALISSNCSRFFVYAGFQINQKFIAETLCINKLRPELHCNGRCYFMKKIKQAEDDEKKQMAKDNLSRLEVSFFQQPFNLALIDPIVIANLSVTLPAYTYWYSSRYVDTIFRPPKQIV